LTVTNLKVDKFEDEDTQDDDDDDEYTPDEAIFGESS